MTAGELTFQCVIILVALLNFKWNLSKNKIIYLQICLHKKYIAVVVLEVLR